MNIICHKCNDHGSVPPCSACGETTRKAKQRKKYPEDLELRKSNCHHTVISLNRWYGKPSLHTSYSYIMSVNDLKLLRDKINEWIDFIEDV